MVSNEDKTGITNRYCILAAVAIVNSLLIIRMHIPG